MAANPVSPLPSARESKRLHLSLPEQSFNFGLTPLTMRVHADRELDCVTLSVRTPDQTIDLLLSLPAAIEAVLRIIGAIDRLQRGGSVLA
jgi:hypothetical protein